MDEPAAPFAVPGAPPRRRRRWLRRAIVGCVLVAATLAALGYFKSYSDLSRAIAETDRVDPGWRWNDLAAHRQHSAGGHAVLDVVALDEKHRATKLNADDEYQLHERIDELFAFPNCRANEEQRQPLWAMLQRRAEYLNDLRPLTVTPPTPVPLKPIKRGELPDFVVAPAQTFREVAKILVRDAVGRAEDGDADGLVADVRALLRLVQTFDGDSTAIATLVRCAIVGLTRPPLERALAQVAMPDDALAALQTAVIEEADKPILAWMARGERAFMFESFEHLKNQPSQYKTYLQLQSALGGPTAPRFREYLAYAPGFFNDDQARSLRAMTELVVRASRPDWERCGELRNWEQRAKEQRAAKQPLGLDGLLLGNVPNMVDAVRRHRATLRCSAVALAAERYRLKHGKWPAGVDALVSEQLLPRPLLDPFDGQSLRWKVVPTGVVIYSVGVDRADDDGDTVKEYGLRVDDVYFRLFDPAQRRLPPRPPTAKPQAEGEGVP